MGPHQLPKMIKIYFHMQQVCDAKNVGGGYHPHLVARGFNGCICIVSLSKADPLCNQYLCCTHNYRPIVVGAAFIQS